MSKAEELIRQEIERTGPLPFSKFVDLALYHPLYGYYNRRAPQRGRNGDYFTSLQVSGLFPAVFARLFSSMQEALGGDQFSLIEVGCGDGEFLEGVLNELSARRGGPGLRVWAVERSRSARERLVKRLSRFERCDVVESLEQVEWMGTLEGCIFSNEFFDALPFDCFTVQDGRWLETVVEIKNGRLVEAQREISAAMQASLPSIADYELQSGHRIERRSSVERLYEEWSALLGRGYVLSVDYGHPRAVMLDPTRANGTAIAYYRHEARGDLLERVGEQDITAHVDFTQLTQAGSSHGWAPEFFCSQGVLLSTVGEPVIARIASSASAVRQLIHPSAMGEKFWALLQAKEAPLPSVLSGVSNRIRRLI